MRNSHLDPTGAVAVTYCVSVPKMQGMQEPIRRRVLVVDDEVTIAEAIAIRLRSESFEVAMAHDGPSAVAIFESFAPDLVVLDVMLPGFDGHEVCRRIQAVRRVPVVMLTARSEETDVLIGLGVGADDYMTKPFSPRELVARIQAVLRRSVETVASTISEHSNSTSAAQRLTFGNVTIEEDSRSVVVNGNEEHLTATEFDIAVWMLRHPRSVFTRGQLLQSVWGYTDTSGERTVDSHIQALRRKLGPAFVRTVHGVGYGLGTPPEKAEKPEKVESSV